MPMMKADLNADVEGSSSFSWREALMLKSDVDGIAFGAANAKLIFHGTS